MSALNSFSVTNDKFAILPELITVEESSRIFSDKGLFIIPYRAAPPVAFVEAICDVLDVSNESRNLWSNPELSFYGYAHTRRFKQPFGSPVQLNLRNQVFFTWFPQENIQIINGRIAMRTILSLQEVIEEAPPWYLSCPCITDFSFGFQKTGKYKITVRIGYFLGSLFQDDPAGPPGYYTPSPEDVKNTDPSDLQDLTDTGEPLSPPYIPSNGDFDESEDNPPLPEEPDPRQFIIRWSTTWINLQSGNPQSSNNNDQTGSMGQGLVGTVGEPVPNPARLSIEHTVTDSQGSRLIPTAPLSTNLAERQEQIQNYQYSVQYL
jgi:hypothetical protein